ncbi:hydantoinase B/oxoprolinase family protein [Chloroflexota bacterium]
MGLIDPATLGVLVSKLFWTTEEMNAYLVRSGFSSNIKVRKDCSCALYTKDGDLLAQGEFIAVHLGVMAQCLKKVLEYHPINTLEEGDAILQNDSYNMGSHLNDFMMFKPLFYEGRIIAFAGNTAHHTDIGAISPDLSARSILDEGQRIPPIKIVKRGKVQEDLIKLIAANSRTPHEIKGDVMAQIAANFRGEQRLIELAHKYGANTLLEYFDAILEYSEKGMRKAISDIPDGEASFEDHVEYEGRLVKIIVKLTKKGSDIYLDFTGSGEATAGSLNAPWSLTHSASYYAIKAVVGPRIPTNEGAYRTIHLLRPKGDSVLDAQFPRAVGNCTGTPTQRVVDVIIGALSKIVPEKVSACDGHWPVMKLIGIDPKKKRFFAYAETYACGRGAKHDDDGADGHHTHMTNTENAPAETIELEYPLRVDKYALIPDSGGAGEFRGGLGITREVTSLVPTSFAVDSQRPTISPYGLSGGEGGGTDSGGQLLEDSTIAKPRGLLKTGERVCIRTSGGGGWGNPLDRPAKKVEWDALNGYISLDAAKNKYGCVISNSGKVDMEETNKLRARLKGMQNKRTNLEQE